MCHKPYIIQFVFLFFLYQTLKYLWKYETLRMESNTDCDRWFKIYFIFFKRKKIYTRQWWHTNKSQWSNFLLFLHPVHICFPFLLSLPHLISSSVRYQINPQFYILFFSFFILHILMYIGRLFSSIFRGFKEFRCCKRFVYLQLLKNCFDAIFRLVIPS